MRRRGVGAFLAVAALAATTWGAGIPAFNIEQRTTAPLMAADQPWESRSLSFLNVIGTNGTWKCWYASIDTNYVSDDDQLYCYATSSNGVDWVKPDLGRVSYQGSTSNNIILRGGGAGAFVFWDGPADRYRMTVIRETNSIFAVFGKDSSNGLDWVEYPDPIFPLNADTQNACLWDVDRYRFYPRMWTGGIGTPNSFRMVGYSESTSFTNFPAPAVILAPDAQDPPSLDFYNSAATKLADELYVMFPSAYYDVDNGASGAGAETVVPHMAVSTNGVDFVKIGHAPAVPLGGATNFDRASIYVGPGCTPGPRTNTWWFHYVGFTNKHNEAGVYGGGLGRFLLTVLPEEDGGAVALPYKTGLLTWLRADDLDADRNVTNNPADGTPVALWKDSHNAAAGYHGAQTNAAKQPLYRTAGGPNHMPLVAFDGTNDFLELPTIAYSGWTVFMVGRMPVGPASTALAFADYGPVPGGGSSFPYLGIYRAAGAFTPYHRDGTAHTIRADDANGWTNFAIRSAWVTNSAVHYQVADGSNTYAGAGTAGAGYIPASFQGYQPPMIGALPPNGDNNANLELCEFLLFDHTLSAVDRAAVEDYLKEKYYPPDTNPAPPTASFTGTPTTGPAPLSATFTDASTGTITNRAWDFGDGQTTNTTAKVLEHSYAIVGSFTVTLTASGPLGTSTVSRVGYINVQGRPLYWDTDGTNSGGSAGTTAPGTWGIDAFWNTAGAGGAGTFITTTTASDDLFFSAGTDVTGASTVTVDGTQMASSLTVEEGQVTVNGDADVGAVTVRSGATLTLPNALSLPACTFTINNAASGAECALRVGHSGALGGSALNVVRLMGGANVIWRAKLAPTETNLALPNNMEWSRYIGIGAAATAPFTLSGAVALTDNTVLYPDASAAVNLAGPISGPFKLTLYPYYTGIALRLSGDNTFSGGLDYIPAVANTLDVARDTAFGTGLVKLGGGNAIVTIRAVDGGYGAARTYANAVQFENTLYGHNFEGRHTFNGPATLNGAGKFRFTSGGSLTLTQGLAETNGTRSVTLENIGGASGTLTIGPLPPGRGNGYATLADLLGGRAYTVIAAGDNALGTNLAATVFSPGSTLGFQGNVDYAAAKAITMGGGGVGGVGAIRNFSGTNSFAGPITLSAATTVTNDSGRLTLRGVVTDGAGAFGLTFHGGGTLALGASNAYDGLTSVNGGTLLADGAQSGAFAVAATAVLGGVGRVGAVGGAGVVSPGHSAGILTASQIDPGGGLDFAFELTAPGSPDYATAAASSNDVLRLTNAVAPFAAPLTAVNVVDVYVNAESLTGGGSFRGAWYTDGAGQDFLPAVSGATYRYYVRGDGLSGTNVFNGTAYYALALYNPSLRVTVSRVNEAGTQFSGVDGFVTEFGVMDVGPLFTTNGTPYAWLAAHGLATPSFEEADTYDVDGDGLAAWEEYWAGTNPTNPASVFGIVSVSTNFTITWLGGTNLTNPDFVIRRSTNLGLADPWTLPPVLFPRTNGSGGSNVWSDPEGVLYGPGIYYRLTAPTHTP